jgi:hypothetical protein
VGTFHNHTDKHTPWSTDTAWRAQAQIIHCSPRQANTGAGQPASATPAPPPIGSHSAQRKWNKIWASEGQSQSINIHDSALNERASHQSISSSTTGRAFRSAVPSASSALGGSSSRHQLPRAWAASLRTTDSRPYLRRQHALATHRTHRTPRLGLMTRFFF